MAKICHDIKEKRKKKKSHCYMCLGKACSNLMELLGQFSLESKQQQIEKKLVHWLGQLPTVWVRCKPDIDTQPIPQSWPEGTERTQRRSKKYEP